ncbi:MAG: sigma-54-dependent Fis family transcriptional regulator [Deltaproteobacteria bacterium]|nr:MAG: sigma-54-dependent Fis family transcriptional regulator [Deltaproteobacteria bacterium]
MSFLHLKSTSLQDWERFLKRTLSPHELSQVLWRCWERAVQHEVNPQGPAQEPVVTAPTLAHKREPLKPLLEAKPDLLNNIADTLSKQNFKLLFTDAEGIVVQGWGGGSFAEHANLLRLIPGSSWHENIRGTNAIGTAITEKLPIAIEGRAHFVQPYHELVCYASPVFDPHGELVGVLDATSYISQANPATLDTVIQAAHSIEDYLRQQELLARGIHLHNTLERLVGRYPEPAFFVESSGMLRFANRQARLAFPSLSAAIPSSNPALFLTRSPLQDVLGCTWSELMDPNNQQLHLEHGLGVHFRVEVEPLGSPPYLAAIVFLERQNARNRKPAPQAKPTATTFAQMHGNDPAFVSTLQKASRLARSNLPLLLLSETGTGKELLARSIHQASPRSQGPFVALNCAALSPQLLESELFGYAPGAFTGAHSEGKQGLLTSAEQGTLFLDEIADTPASFQALLLRFLEDGSYYRVGDTQLRHANVRLVCATSQELEEQVQQGSFRQDLFYRIRGAVLTLPPLRQRSDLKLLVQELLQELAQELSCKPPLPSQAALALLSNYTWPGNIRELRHALHYAIVLAAPHTTLEPEHLPDFLQETSPALPIQTQASVCVEAPSASPSSIKDSKVTAVKRALERAQGNVSEAARMLGVARSTIYRMLRRQKD